MLFSISGSVKIKANAKRILLGQLGSFGDCLYATTIAHQIKADYPECHLTWAIGSPYLSILLNNPHVDAIWEFNINNREELLTHWQQFENEALERKRKGDFDEIFFTQVFPGNIRNYDGTLRSSIFRAYPHPITVHVNPVINLMQSEIDNVRRFARTHILQDFSYIILFECSPKSGQSFVTPSFAMEAAQMIVNRRTDICVIISSDESFNSSHVRIINGSILSFRENLYLINYCNMIVGCSSGISWLATSSEKKVPMIQLLERNKFMYASFLHDFKFHGLETDHILEMTNCSPEKLVDCISLFLSSGFNIAKEKYGEDIPVRFNFYWISLIDSLVKGDFEQFYSSIKVTCNRWGFHTNFILSFIVTFLNYLAPRPIKMLSRLFTT